MSPFLFSAIVTNSDKNAPISVVICLSVGNNKNDRQHNKIVAFPAICVFFLQML